MMDGRSVTEQRFYKMKIALIFHSSLKKYNNDVAENEIEIPDGITVGELISKTEVPKAEIAFAAVNGSRVPLFQKIKDGDEVKLFQLVGGG